VFPCGHYFCDACAQQQLAAASPSCPYCRKHVTKTGVFRVSLAGSGAHDPEVAPPEGAAVRDIKVWYIQVEGGYCGACALYELLAAVHMTLRLRHQRVQQYWTSRFVNLICAMHFNANT
jgi:hypothetical protein